MRERRALHAVSALDSLHEGITGIMLQYITLHYTALHNET